MTYIEVVHRLRFVLNPFRIVKNLGLQFHNNFSAGGCFFPRQCEVN